jgi:hypothetical protein
MPYRTIIDIIGGAARTVTEAYEDVTEKVRALTPKPIGQALDVVAETFERGFQKTPVGVAERGAQIVGERVGKATGSPVLGGVTGFALGAAIPGPGLAKSAQPVIRGAKAIPKPRVEPDDIMMMPPGLTPAMAGGIPATSFRGGAAKLDLSPQVMEITVDPKFRAPGMVQDVAQQPEFRGALDRRAAALDEVQSNIARREAQGKTAAKYKKELAGKGSTLDYDPNDPIVFEKNRYKVYDPLDPQRTAHQHHLFAKAQSYPFVEKMEDLISKGAADEDDLVNMFAWADMLDVTMGNTRKNMLDAPGRSHIAAAPGSTDLDKSLNIHALLQEFGLEIPGKQVREMVKDAKNATELMDIFNNYIVESVKPQKRVAQRIVEDFITRHRSTLPKDQLSMFDDLVSKLGGRYKPR